MTSLHHSFSVKGVVISFEEALSDRHAIEIECRNNRTLRCHIEAWDRDTCLKARTSFDGKIAAEFVIDDQPGKSGHSTVIHIH